VASAANALHQDGVPGPADAVADMAARLAGLSPADRRRLSALLSEGLTADGSAE